MDYVTIALPEWMMPCKFRQTMANPPTNPRRICDGWRSRRNLETQPKEGMVFPREEEERQASKGQRKKAKGIDGGDE